MKHTLTNPWHEVIRFDEGDEVVSALAAFVKEKNIRAGWVFAIGSVKAAELSYYDMEQKQYVRTSFKEFMEIGTISGNIAWKEEEPIPHLHGSLGRTDHGTISGHIHALTTAATVEVFIHKIEGDLSRAYDEKTGLNLLR